MDIYMYRRIYEYIYVSSVRVVMTKRETPIQYVIETEIVT